MHRYRFIHAGQLVSSLALLCRVLGVARSGYYAWARREVAAGARADAVLTPKIALIHETGRRAYVALRARAGAAVPTTLPRMPLFSAATPAPPDPEILPASTKAS